MQRVDIQNQQQMPEKDGDDDEVDDDDHEDGPATMLSLTSEQMQNVSNILNAVDKNGDGTLDMFELHSVLISQGILMPIDVVASMFSVADTNSDGKLSLEEFGHFLLASGPSSSSGTRRAINFNCNGVDNAFCYESTRRILLDVECWSIMLLVVGGGLNAIAAFSKDFLVSSILYLVCGVMYLFVGLTFVIPFPIKLYNAELSFQRTAIKLQESFMRKALAYSKPPTPPKEDDSRAGDLTLKTPGSPMRKDPSVMNRKLKKKVFANTLNWPDQSPESYQIEMYLNEIIFAECQQPFTMTKTDFELSLLKELGPYVISERLLHAIFEFVDEDESGTVHVDEFHAFIHQFEPRTVRRERLWKVLGLTILDVEWILGIVFVLGSIISVVHHSIMNFSAGVASSNLPLPAAGTVYAYLVGTLVFSAQTFRHHYDSYNMEEKVRKMVKVWMRKSENANNQSWRALQQNVTLSKDNLNRLLEESAVFIPRFQLDSLYQQICSGEDTVICKDDLEAFLRIRRNRLATIWCSCLKSPLFMASLIWVVGTIGFILSIHTNNITGRIGLQIGGVSYFVGGLVALTSKIMVNLQIVAYKSNARRAIYMLGSEGLCESDSSRDEEMGGEISIASLKRIPTPQSLISASIAQGQTSEAYKPESFNQLWLDHESSDTSSDVSILLSVPSLHASFELLQISFGGEEKTQPLGLSAVEGAMHEAESMLLDDVFKMITNENEPYTSPSHVQGFSFVSSLVSKGIIVLTHQHKGGSIANRHKLIGVLYLCPSDVKHSDLELITTSLSTDGSIMFIDVPWILHDGVTSRLAVDLPLQCEKVCSPPSFYYSHQGNGENWELQWRPTFAYFVLQVSTGKKVSPTRTSNLRRFKRDMENRYYRNNCYRPSTSSYYDGSIITTPSSMILGSHPPLLLPRRHSMTVGGFEGSTPTRNLSGDRFSVFDEQFL
uniref:EF-hand domain-containing protein n=1 Tax=Chaetoceros debilis TaxID=122233 RepID=A0A7S3Q5V8_9STRA